MSNSIAITGSSIVAPFVEPFADSIIPSCWRISGPQAWKFTKAWPAYGAAGATDNTNGGNGYFAGVDGSGTVGLTGITLFSPTIDLAPLNVPRVKFYLFNNNISTTNIADEQSLTIDLWDGAAWQGGAFIWPFGQNAPGWQEVVINLAQ